MSEENKESTIVQKLQNLLKFYGEDVIASLIEKMRNKNASFEFVNSLRYELKNDLNQIILTVYGSETGIFINDGRKANSKPSPISNIKKWLTYKGLPESAAFPVARHIGRFGIEPTPLLKDFLTNDKNDELKNRISEIAKKEIETTLKEFVNEANKK
jgi:hypothetical protein